MTAELDIRGLTRDEYDLLVEAGKFEGERLELLEGRLVRMRPTGPRHALVIELLTELLFEAYRGLARVRVQSPFIVPGDSEPEPDLAVVDRLRDTESHPEKAWLVIEVADSSRTRDLRIKQRLYAAAGIDPYWVVDLKQEHVAVHSDLGSDGYAVIELVGAGGRLALPGVAEEVAVDDLLGR